MTNILSDDKRKQVLALGQLGWTLRRIEQATGVRRETASVYLRAAGLAVRPPGRWGQPAEPVSPARARARGQRVRPVSRADRGGPRPWPRRHGDLARPRR